MTKLSDLVKKAGSDRLSSSPSAAGLDAKRQILLASDDTVQQVSGLYNTAVHSLHEVVASIRAGSENPDLSASWAAAETLIPEINANARVLFALVSQDYDENTISRHSVNVFLLAMRCAEFLSLDVAEQVAIGQAALYHDLGLALVAQDIVDKTGPLSAKEDAEIKRHVESGVALLEPVGNDLLCDIVRQSHERVDGNGYPNGLTDTQIHPLAKLLHAVDSFEAIVHHRSYQPKLSPFEAMKTVKEGIGTHFGEDAFRLLLKAVTVFPIGTLVELNTRERAKVIEASPGHLLRPVVAVLTDAEGKLLPKSRFLDLSGSRGVFIERAIVDQQLHEKARDIF